LVRDDVVNTFTFDVIDGGDPDTYDEIASHIHSFYELTDGLVLTPMSRYIGNAINRSVIPVIRIYDVTAHLGGTPAGSPVAMRDFGTALTPAASATDLPSEAAVAVSFQADYLGDVEFGPSTRPRARDRARIYLGPLNLTAAATTLGICRPDTDLRTNLAESAARLARGGPLAQLVVWSRKGGTTKQVKNVWVDDAFDTQRRRGQAPTGKLLRVV
jgi:hypothetical protein